MQLLTRGSGKNDLGSTHALPLSPEPWGPPSAVWRLLAQLADGYALTVYARTPPASDSMEGSMCFLHRTALHPGKASAMNSFTSPPFTLLPA